MEDITTVVGRNPVEQIFLYKSPTGFLSVPAKKTLYKTIEANFIFSSGGFCFRMKFRNIQYFFENFYG